jgi:phosphate transport system permease protein
MKKILDGLMKFVFFLSAVASVFSLLLICFFLFAKGVPTIFKIGVKNFLFGQKWAPTDNPPSFGIFSMIVGSFLVTFGSCLFGVPLGVLTAVFMARFCPHRIYKFFKPAVEVLAGIPSIVYGFFGMIVLCPLFKKLFGVNGNNIITASILLGIMILPSVIELSETALEAVPENYYEGALALGSSHERSVFCVVLPAAKSGIVSATLLGVSRAVGETMAVIMIAGNQARVPQRLFDGVRTLTGNIVIEMGYATGLHRDALIATGVVLFVFLLVLNFVVIWSRKRKAK